MYCFGSIVASYSDDRRRAVGDDQHRRFRPASRARCDPARARGSRSKFEWSACVTFSVCYSKSPLALPRSWAAAAGQIPAAGLMMTLRLLSPAQQLEEKCRWRFLLSTVRTVCNGVHSYLTKSSSTLYLTVTATAIILL
jgi:hypothetical protein